jgi:hypothetical protein
MAWVCLACTTVYSVGAAECPHCGCTEYVEEGTDMAKISRHGGPSNKAVGVVESAPVEAVVAEPVLEPDDAPDGPYAAMLRADLQAECAKRGLPTSGSKAELIARLTEADQAEMDALATEQGDPL